MPPGSASQLVLIKVAPPVASAPRLGPDGAFFVRPLHAACHQPAMQAATRRLEHAHEVHHVVLVEKGHSMFLFGGEAVDALPGTLFLISPGQPHSFDVPRGHGVWYSEVTFEIVTSSGNPVHETLHKLLASWSGLFLEPWHQGSPVDPPTFAALSGLIRSVVAAGSQTGVADTFDLDIALTALLHRIAKTMAAPPTDVHDPVKVVHEALAAVGPGLPSIAVLARRAGISHAHLTREYRRRYGLAPTHFRRQLQIEAVCRLLAKTDYPLKQIAPLTGFHDEFHLGRIFRAQTGQTPGQYRKRIRSLRDPGV